MVLRLCLLSMRCTLRLLVLLWWSVKRHRTVVSLLNFSETGIKGLVQILICGIDCFLASCIELILEAIVVQTSFCVACLRFIGSAESFSICAYLVQSAASVCSHLTFLKIGLDEIVSFMGMWSEVLTLSGVM